MGTVFYTSSGGSILVDRRHLQVVFPCNETPFLGQHLIQPFKIVFLSNDDNGITGL